MTQPGRRGLASLGDWLTRHPYLLPLAILIVGAAFRFYNLNWDNGHQLHPDERWIYMVVSGANTNPPLQWPTSVSQFLSITPRTGSPLDPHFFAYGSLPFYLLAFLGGAASILGQHLPFLSGWADANSYSNLPMLGRGLSATLDLFAVLLVFLIGRKVFGYWTAVLGMALTAFTVLDIQLSHFYAVDTVLTPLVLLTLLGCVTIATSADRHPYIWTGIVFGAALATKTTALLLVIPLGAAPILQAWTSVRWPSTGSLRNRVISHYGVVAPRLNDNLQRALLLFFIGAATFVICEPYAVLDRTQLLSDISQQTQFLVTNNPPFQVPFTVQYADTTPYVYQIANLLFWSLGLPLAIPALLGILFVAVRSVWGRIRPEYAVLALWVIPYFLFVGRFFAKFNRYMLPITPILALCGAALLVALLRFAAGRWKLLAVSVIIASTGLSFAYSFAYMNIYAHPNTRVEASRWIFNHVPASSTIGVEGPWDDPLPVDEQGHTGSVYHEINLDLYAGEDQQVDVQKKIANITDALQHTSYIVMSSERMIGSIPKLPYHYPIATRYYQLLFGDKLNFRLVDVFQRHPQLGPIIVHDYPADESFHVYDHPIVRVWKRVAPISTSQVRHLLLTGLPKLPANTDPATVAYPLRPVIPAPDSRLMLTPKQWQTDQTGPTMDQMFPPAGFAMQHPIIIWLLLIELLGLIAFPFAFLVFRNLEDRGFVIAKTLGLLLTGYLLWISVSASVVNYDRAPAIGAVVVLALTALGLGYRMRAEIISAVERSWRPMLAGELVFLIGFALFIALRMWYPDLGLQNSPVSATNVGVGRMGEKQMELAYLNAIVRSRVFPPLDPFFAHGYINYYYYGFFLVGTLCKLTQIVPATGFNLAVATFFALLVANCYSVGLSLTRRIAPGVLAAAFVGVFGNLNGGWQLIRGLWSVATIQSGIPIVGGLIDTLSGLQRVLIGHQPLPPFDYWESTRIVPGGAITEFPFFTYLFADLHPHLMAYPMAAAVIALAVNIMRGGYASVRSRMLAVLCAGILIGAIAVTNPWDFPTYLVVIGLGALLASFAVRRRWSFRLALRPAGWLASLAALSLVLYLPFERNYQTVFATGIGLTKSISADMLLGNGVCTGAPATACPGIMHDILVTPLRIYLEHFGLFLFAIVSFLILLLVREVDGVRRARRGLTWLQFGWYYRDRPRTLWHAATVARTMKPKRKSSSVSSWLWTVAFVAAGLALLQYFLLAFLSALIGVTLVVALCRAARAELPELFLFGLVVLGGAIAFVTQIVFFKDWLAQGPSFRMNTIFKFYDQIWLMSGIAAACGLYFLMTHALRLPTVAPEVWRHPQTLARMPGMALVSRLLPSSRVIESAPTQLAFAVSSHASGSTTLDVIPSGETTQNDRHEPRVAQRSLAAQFMSRYPLWTSCLALLTAGSLIYTYAGTVSRETVRSNWLPAGSVPATLDGLAFAKVAYPGDYGAIQWLNAHVHGAPVIAEATGAYYDWRSRISMFTGLPSVINGIHEPEQRLGDEIDPSALCGGSQNSTVCLARLHPRSLDVNTLYDSSSVSTAWSIIHQYGIRYIVVGSAELVCDKANQQCYSRDGLAKFPRLVGHGLTIVYRAHNTTLYRVSRP